MRTPLLRRLSFRIRVLCVGAFVAGSLLPPYIPSAILAEEGSEIVAPQFLFVEDGFLMKTSTLGQQGVRLAYSEGLVHTVQAGETLNAIAQKYGISPQTIRWVNNLEGAAKPGQELIIIPVDGVLHTVTRGQTLGRIAQLYNVPMEDIAEQNKIKGGLIVAGQQLVIPGGKPVEDPTFVASSPTPSPDQGLQFADRLPDRNIALKLPQRPGPSAPATTGTVDGGRPRPRPEPAAAVPTSGTLQMPCNNCFYTQYYNRGHYAVDIQTKGGGPIFAAEDGTVIRADTGWNGGYGNVIEIDNGNGRITLYAHNKELYAKVGDKVTRGQEISWMGNTGFVYGKTGIHVHFEVRERGVKKNPLLYLQ